jgi:hypothetical protein
MSQEDDENGGDSVNTVKENKKIKNTGKQSCSSKGIRKMSPDSSLTAKQTRRGKSESVASYVSTSGSSRSSLQENLNEELINEMASINLDSEKFKLGCVGHTIEKGKERKSHRSVKASEFLFTPLRTRARKERDETIVPSSPDEHLGASRKTTALPEENKVTEWRKIVFASPSSDEEKPSNLKARISSGTDKTLQKLTVLPQENKGTERRKKFAFSSSSSEEKPSNSKACISSDKDKPLKKMTVLPRESKGTEQRKKMVFSSSSEEKPMNLKACISSDKDKTLQTMKPRTGVSSSKKKQLLPRHPFILN